MKTATKNNNAIDTSNMLVYAPSKPVLNALLHKCPQFKGAQVIDTLKGTIDQFNGKDVLAANLPTNIASRCRKFIEANYFVDKAVSDNVSAEVLETIIINSIRKVIVHEVNTTTYADYVLEMRGEQEDSDEEENNF